MSKKDKPLPKPASTPFGKKRSFEQGNNKEPLMADQMAMAMSKGKLDEFIKKELPDNEHARKLAEMMMGMTGIMPQGMPAKPAQKKEGPSKKAEPPRSEGKPSAVKPPDDVVNAVKDADVGSLMQLLKREHRKQQGIKDEPVDDKKRKAASAKTKTAIEKEILEQMLKIALENDLSPDWIFFRALKCYVQEYKKTGNL